MEKKAVNSYGAVYQDRSTYNPLFPLFIYYDLLCSTNSIGLHWHDEIEMLTVLKGKVELLYESQTLVLDKGDSAFVNSSCLHGYRIHPQSDEHPLARAILINPGLLTSNGYDIVQSKYIGPLLSGELNLPVLIHEHSPQYKEIRQILDKIADLFGNADYGNEIRIKALLYEMLFSLLLPSKSQWEECYVGSEQNRADSERFKEVLTYIYEHCDKKIRIKDMAEYMHMSEGHFSRFFKRMTQKTPIEYINGYKISEAAKMLRETDKKEIEIAFDIGFDNFSYFICIFKSIVHCTPSQYRKNERMQIG